ncbi:hypothetical protein HK097_000559 [Rhizophlyctis rosea]|uniref:Structure-specific endonuclease subunit SLX4 n=1 Tax=Rhizophlyctis rosea TaxID=64517 RepID=A0AAD5SLF5_9FUNG|nr:hypothetical protein HK097_000559 [Rhizophlyctis rosea]
MDSESDIEITDFKPSPVALADLPLSRFKDTKLRQPLGGKVQKVPALKRTKPFLERKRSDVSKSSEKVVSRYFATELLIETVTINPALTNEPTKEANIKGKRDTGKQTEDLDWYTIAPPPSSNSQKKPNHTGPSSAAPQPSSIPVEPPAAASGSSSNVKCPICGLNLKDASESVEVHVNRCIDKGGTKSKEKPISLTSNSDLIERENDVKGEVAESGPADIKSDVMEEPKATTHTLDPDEMDVPPLPPPLKLSALDGKLVPAKRVRKPRKKKEEGTDAPKPSKRGKRAPKAPDFTLDFSKVDTSRRNQKKAAADPSLVLPAEEALEKMNAKAEALLLRSGETSGMEGIVVEGISKVGGKRMSILVGDGDLDELPAPTETVAGTLWDLSAAADDQRRSFYTELLSTYQEGQAAAVQEETPLSGADDQILQSYNDVIDGPVSTPFEIAETRNDEPNTHAHESVEQTVDQPLVDDTNVQEDTVSAILENYERLIAMEKADYQKRLEALDAQHNERMKSITETRDRELAIARGELPPNTSGDPNLSDEEIVPETPLASRRTFHSPSPPSPTPSIHSDISPTQDLFRELVDAVSEGVDALEEILPEKLLVPASPVRQELMVVENSIYHDLDEFRDVDEEGDMEVLTQVRFRSDEEIERDRLHYGDGLSDDEVDAWRFSGVLGGADLDEEEEVEEGGVVEEMRFGKERFDDPILVESDVAEEVFSSSPPDRSAVKGKGRNVDVIDLRDEDLGVDSLPSAFPDNLDASEPIVISDGSDPGQYASRTYDPHSIIIPDVPLQSSPDFDIPCPFEYEYEDNRTKKRDVPYRFSTAGEASGGKAPVASQTAAKRKGKGVGAAAVSASGGQGAAGAAASQRKGKGKAVAVMPDYKGMNVVDLRKIGKQYGLRPGCKAMLVKELTKIWMVLNGQESARPAAASSSQSPSRAVESTNVPDSCGESSDEEEDEFGGGDVFDEGEVVGTQLPEGSVETMEERLYNFVRGQTNLYTRILRYEPIDFELLHEQVKQLEGLEKCNKKILGAFLDKRSINYCLPTKPGNTKRRRYR